MQVDSDLQTLEDFSCETLDPEITMETAQNKLDKFQPLVAGLKDSYPSVKELGNVEQSLTPQVHLVCGYYSHNESTSGSSTLTHL